jgi:hypothetical protein
MELLIIHLRAEGHLEDLMTALTAAGIHHAALVNGTDMRQILAVDIPIFAGFKRELGAGSDYCRVVLAELASEGVRDDLLAILDRAGIDLRDPEVATAYIVPCRGI